MLQVENRLIPPEEYQRIVDVMPILCVDLVLYNSLGWYLLVLRNNEPLKGQWWVPGGRVHKGETLVQAATRKAQEELSVDVSSLRLVGYHEYLPSTLYGNRHVVSFVFTGMVETTNVVLDSQSSALGLFADLPTEFTIMPFGGSDAS